MFDTGSALTWIQCTPCQHCYDQQEPLFNPNQSSTFALATCDSSPTEPPCNYSIPYRDKSYSKGYYATDTVTFSESDTFPFFVFGCGQNTTTSFGQVAGVLGVGQGSVRNSDVYLFEFITDCGFIYLDLLLSMVYCFIQLSREFDYVISR